MSKFEKAAKLIIILCLLAILSVACSGEGKTTTESPAVPEQQQKPVTLTVFTPASNGSLEQFTKEFGSDIQKKFPHVSFDYVGGAKWGVDIPAVLGTNQTIDFVVVQAVSFNHVVKIFDLQYDIEELIKTKKYDLSHIQPNIIEGMRGLTPGGKLYGLPVSTSNFALMYNKDLFDRFGVAYPKDGMTWDEVYDLARKLTRTEEGVQYYGLVTDFVAYSLFNQLSASYIDPATNKAMFSSDPKWTALTSNITRFFQTSGMDLSKGWTWDAPSKRFHTEHVAAMNFYAVPPSSTANWDMVTSPVFKDAPGIGTQGNPLAFFPTSMSKHKELVFDIMTYLTSEEYQLEKAKEGVLPVLTSNKVRDAFGQDVVGYKDRNVKALVSNKSAIPSLKTDQYADGHGIIAQAMIQVASGVKDVNTALREADEKLNLKIKEAEQQKLQK
ncbi:extracellular solute-binding protein [Paenibacillus oceani]|uniref:Extracellular solute-binding protein n=1 Tax=Paenibacillus oceani TaxID=2772510 RepID=A0A927C9V1_9BACL|nr:extracellular solute-binding protein [Paenibacillus oceani]MBD2863499.1 extracellular solute-binding protein [Paenibacillus oceani]